MLGSRNARSWMAAAVAVPVLVTAFALPAEARGGSKGGGGGSKPTAVDQYVALGDSYASGNGTGDADLAGYYGCYRSSSAYPALVAANRPNTKLSFQACSGATTSDLINGQDSALSRKTTLVTVSVGGNDIGFSSLITSCYNTGDDSQCARTVDAVKQRIATELPSKLAAVYSDIRSRAPKAAVMVVGYPKAFGTNADGSYKLSCTAASGISQDEAGWLNQVAADLDTTIGTAATTAGFTYLRTIDAFTGHDICAATPYLNGKTGLLNYPDMYHPTKAGHADGFYPLVRASMG